MKKTFTLLSMMLAGSLAFAQSQRLVLVEAFSQASCGPCAAQNPALNAALTAATIPAIGSAIVLLPSCKFLAIALQRLRLN